MEKFIKSFKASTSAHWGQIEKLSTNGSTKVSSNLLRLHLRKQNWKNFSLYRFGNWISKCCFAYTHLESEGSKEKIQNFSLTNQFISSSLHKYFPYHEDYILYKCPDSDVDVCSWEQYGWEVSIPSNRSIVNKMTWGWKKILFELYLRFIHTEF